MRRELHDGDGGVGQAQRSWQETEILLAELAVVGLGAAALALDVVGEITAASGVAGWQPLQHQTGVVQVEHRVAGRRWRA